MSNFENPVIVVRNVLGANLTNPNTISPVTHQLITDYLKIYPPRDDITDRVAHFKQWLRGDFS